jgi:hypothetical protein
VIIMSSRSCTNAWTIVVPFLHSIFKESNCFINCYMFLKAPKYVEYLPLIKLTNLMCKSKNAKIQ